MWALRRKLGLADDALLLVGVDELIELEKKYGSNSTSLFLSTIMQAQDESLLSGHRPVVFIWTALVESYIKMRASDSGRKGYGGQKTAVATDTRTSSLDV